jgi:hypothetical protein
MVEVGDIPKIGDIVMAILSLNPDFDDPMHFPGVIKEITPDGKVKVDVTVGSFTTHRTFALATLAPDPNGVGWIIVPPGQPSSSTPSL